MLSPTKLPEKPVTPPPPIISENHSPTSNGKENKKANLDLVRAKLANATNRDKLSKQSIKLTNGKCLRC